MRFLVVDINVILSSLISQGHSFKIFELNAEKEIFRFVAPEFIIVEAGKHMAEIARRSKLPFEEILKDMEIIKKQIHFISEEYYKNKIKEAQGILKDHLKDVPYLALALSMNCNILSGDKIFKQHCPDIVKTPRDILEEFFN